MKIEGTPEEIADFVRRMMPPQDIKPTFVPTYVPAQDPYWIPYIGDYPTTDRVSPHITWQVTPTIATNDSNGIGDMYSCANVKDI